MSAARDTGASSEKLRAQANAALLRVRARLAAHQKALLLMSPGSSQRVIFSQAEATWAHTLHAGDLDKLSASLASSLAHDALVLREMMPSFQGMFAAVCAHQQKDTTRLPALGPPPPPTCTMHDVRQLLEVKLELPIPSCDSIMQVLNLALQSCLTAAESAHSAPSLQQPAANSSSAGKKKAIKAPVAPAPSNPTSDTSAADSVQQLPPSAFSGPLSSAAFAAVLSKALHLQSAPFSHFLSQALNFVAGARAVCSQVFLGQACHWKQP